jgi:proline iminopeptidase
MMYSFNRRRLLASAGAVTALSILGGVSGGRAAMAAPDPETAGYISVKGGRVWYRMNGVRHFRQGKTPLVVIHGGPGMSHHYLSTLTDLASDRPVILYDQLDSGNSDRPGKPGNWVVERFVSEIDSIRDALGLDKILVLGNSWGGTVAAEYAMTQPKGLQGLVLASPLISTPRWISDNTNYRKKLPPDVQHVLDENEAAGTTDSQAYQDAVMVFYLRHFNRMEPWPQELLKTFEVFNFDIYVTMWGNTEFNATGTLKDYDSTDRLGRIQAPTLYTCGQFDEATPEACKDFSSMTPDSEVRVIADASHTAFLEQREAYMGVVREFFAGLA